MLSYFKEPKGLTGRETYQLDPSLSILQNMENHFPRGLDHNVTDFYINGEKIDPLVYDLSRPATVLDEVVIINRQQGVGAIVGIVVSVISAVLSMVLAPKPKMPNAVGEQKESSNNKLTSQANIARLYQAKPDIYGTVRVYPDIINPAGSEYIDNIKYLEHLFCIGIGQYQMDKFKYDQTLLNKINGTTYQVYQKGDVIPEIRYQFSSAEVNGQELVPPNLSDEILYETELDSFISYQLSGDTATITLPDDDSTRYFKNLSTPAQINYIINADITSERYSSNSGGTKTYVTNTNIRYRAVLQRTSVNDQGQLVLTCNTIVNLGYSANITGNITSTAFNTRYLKLMHTGGVYTDAFVLSEKGTEIWADVTFQRGLKGYVQLRFIWWQIDDLGNEIANSRETLDWDINKDTYEPQSLTVKLTPKGGLAKYALIAGRLNNGKSDLSDQAKVENVFIVSYDYNFPVNDTLVYVRTRATSQATSLKELKFNLEATRKTISYHRDSQRVDYTLKPSRSFADAVLHEFVAVSGRSPDELDLASLYDIDARLKLTDERMGYFDFSFDDIDISLGQRIETICNAARVYTYRDGQKWRFSRNEEKTRPVAMFNSLNLVNSNEGGTVQKKSSLPSAYDGVQVEYVDASKDNPSGTDKKAYINLKISKGEIVEGHAFRPNKIALSGCRNREQALNRAQLEIRQLIYQRTFIEDEVIQDATMVDKGDLVLWADTWDDTIASGEIINIVGDQFFVDQVLTLEPGEQYRVAITNKGGYPSNWIVLDTFDSHSFTANFKEGYTANNIDIQMGSIFIITKTVSEEPTEFLLLEKQFSEGAHKIKLANYDPRIYQHDRKSGFFIS